MHFGVCEVTNAHQVAEDSKRPTPFCACVLALSVLGARAQILVCTSTLAWGVNFPAHLVVVKGTEYYDGKSKRYVDFPITDVLQMMGRAGRPQFDDHGVAVIMVHEPKKSFIKKVRDRARGQLVRHQGRKKSGVSLDCACGHWAPLSSHRLPLVVIASADVGCPLGVW